MSRHAVPVLALLVACGGPTPASLCDDTVAALEHCIEENADASYTIIQDADACQESFDACSASDLELLDEYIGCYRDACDATGCTAVLNGVDSDCIVVYSYATT